MLIEFGKNRWINPKNISSLELNQRVGDKSWELTVGMVGGVRINRRFESEEVAQQFVKDLSYERSSMWSIWLSKYFV